MNPYLFFANLALTGVKAGTDLMAARAETRYQRSVLASNQRLAELQAEDAIRRGGEAAFAHRRQVKQLMGRQRAVAAAQGGEVSSGSALDILTETEMQGRADQDTIRLNAYREALGYRQEAGNLNRQRKMLNAATAAKQRGTILETGLMFGRELYDYSTRK